MKPYHNNKFLHQDKNLLKKKTAHIALIFMSKIDDFRTWIDNHESKHLMGMATLLFSLPMQK